MKTGSEVVDVSMPGPPALDQPGVRQLVCQAAAEVAAELPRASVRALILTGSVARDEATVIPFPGGVRLLGDVEFLLVTDRPPRRDDIENRIEKRMRSRGLKAHATVGIVGAHYFQRLRPTIFACELCHWGRTVFGHDLLSVIRPFRVEQISREDAWRLLANRMVELVETMPLLEPDRLPERVSYASDKLVLDCATSFLVFVKEYAPSYRERLTKLSRVARKPPRDVPFPLQDFCELVRSATRRKLEGPGDALADHNFLEAAVQHALRLAEWELRHLAARIRPVTGDMNAWMVRQSARKRLRGWLYVLRAQGWGRSWRHWPRWVRLFRTGSPRHHLYAATCRLLFRRPWLLGSVAPEGLEEIAAHLPVRSPSPLRWEDLARDLAWNYHRFVENTLA